MEFSKFISDFSSVLTTQHKKLLVIGSLVALYLAVVYLEKYLKGKKGKTSYFKGNILNIDVEDKEGFRALIVLGIIVLSMVIFYKFPSGPTLLGLFLVCIGVYIYASIYASLDHAPGIYKNGKYLGAIYKGFIKAGDNLAIGRKQDTETIGSLKILRNGKEVVKLALTPEGFIELKPDKIWEIFPEIKGNIEKFEKLFKVGDYTLQYSLFTRSYRYEESYGYGYEGGYQFHSFDDDTDLLTDPTYSFLPGNIYHND